MAEEKAESSCEGEDGTSSKAGQAKEGRGLILLYETVARLLDDPETVALIAGSLMKEATEGRPVSVKMIVDFAGRARRPEAVSDEECETLGQLLMREFGAFQQEKKDE